MRETITYGGVVGALSIVAVIAAIYLVFTDNKSAALTMGALFVATAIVSQLHNFKSFKAFSVEAQLQDRIEKADELINRLRALSLLVGKAGYATSGVTTMAFGGVQASSYSLTTDFDALLKELHLTAAEQRDVRQPLVRAIGFRIFMSFMNIAGTMNSYVSNHRDDKAKNLTATDLNQVVTAAQAELLNINSEDDLRALLWKTLPGGLGGAQKEAARTHIEKLVRIFLECKEQGGPTQEFLHLERSALIGYPNSGRVAEAIYDGKDPT